MTPLRLAILCPVYNDWDSFHELVKGIDEVPFTETRVSIVAVNDGSSVAPPAQALSPRDLPRVSSVECIDLCCNMGHQRAIAVGLLDIAEAKACDVVAVMDADGEDPPQALPRLLDAHRRAPGDIILARRARRSEGPLFRAFYLLYLFLFRILTGETIRSGNYCLIPVPVLTSLLSSSDIWSNLAASILKARIPVTSVAVDRGPRYAGRSKMNFVRLIMHGLSALSVFSEVCFTRILLMSIGIEIVSLLGVAVVFVIRVGTDLAIPGWASNLVLMFGILFVQAVILSVMSMLFILNNRSAANLLPTVDPNRFVKARRRVLE